MKTLPIVLASASSARAAVLRNAGIAFTIYPADVDEGEIKRKCRADDLDSATCALRLAAAKAREVTARHPGCAVVGADQILDLDGEWFDKPSNPAAARVQLLKLRGRWHTLVTAATVWRDGEALWQACEMPRLKMREFTEPFLDAYLEAAGQQVLGSVGAYALEGPGAQLFECIEGDYFAVLGLPLIALLGALREIGAVAR